ncbi:uncharacterized protein LOC135221236 [Macrobrachium nipponense]|uniref:uncharacterized protein LOC135221236 n=1 Tax=Macrobrachium nipponense TaxID=159736 RepID=UPI0030C8A29B
MSRGSCFAKITYGPNKVKARANKKCWLNTTTTTTTIPLSTVGSQALNDGVHGILFRKLLTPFYRPSLPPWLHVVLFEMAAADPVADPEPGHFRGGFHRGFGGFGGHGFGYGAFRGKRSPVAEALADPEPEADPGHFGGFGGDRFGYGAFRGKRTPVAEPEPEADPGFHRGFGGFGSFGHFGAGRYYG